MTALYQRVSEKIMRQITNGEIAVGTRLPPEAVYAAELGVSRSTLRLAFSELENSGILARKKRAGTYVISDRAKPRFNMATSNVDELLSLGRDTEFEIVGTRTVRTEAIPQLTGFESETGHWLEVSGKRTLPGKPSPFSINRVYVPARFAAIEPLLDSSDSSVFGALEKHFRVSVSRVCQTVRAISCPDEDALTLGLDNNAPVLAIEAQLYTGDDTLLEVSFALFDPSQFQLHTDVRID